MGALASSAVTVELGWEVVSTPIKVKTKQLTLVLSSQGGATNTVDASTLGFTKILGCSSAQISDDATFRPVVPSYDGSKLFFYSIAVTTDADRPKPIDVTGTFRLLVWGV